MSWVDDTGLSYFWGKIKSLVAGYLPLSGGTMTGQIRRTTANLDYTEADNGLSSYWNPIVASFRDKNDLSGGFLQGYATTSGNMSVMLDARNHGTGSVVTNQLQLTVKNDGSREVSVSEGKPWRNGIGIGFGTGTITKVYSNNGFKLENTTFYYAGNVVTIPIQFVATTNFAGNGTTVAARIPEAYAPPGEIRFAMFCTQIAWTDYMCCYGIIKPTGDIMFLSRSAGAWFGSVTYVRDF